MRLFAISVGALTPVLGTWPATGMAGSDTLDVDFDEVPAQPVGVPGAYVDRPGFAHGGVGVAACWYGGARAVAGALLSAAGRRDAGRMRWPTSARWTSRSHRALGSRHGRG